MLKKKPAAEKKIGVIYARFSSHNQREESIEQQVAECKAFAARSDIEIVGVYADSAKTGRTDRRPQFQKLGRDAEKGIFNCIIAYKSNRIARNILNALVFENDMDELGIEVRSRFMHFVPSAFKGQQPSPAAVLSFMYSKKSKTVFHLHPINLFD